MGLMLVEVVVVLEVQVGSRNSFVELEVATFEQLNFD